MNNLVERLREIANDLEKTTAGIWGVLSRFAAHHDKAIRVNQLRWYNHHTDTGIVIVCDPPITVCVTGIYDIQEMDGYHICNWHIRVCGDADPSTFKNVDTLYVNGLASDEETCDAWEIVPEKDAFNVPYPPLYNSGDPRIATTKWQYWDDPEDAWRIGVAPPDEGEGEYVDSIVMNFPETST
jgi:hypothetical protein